MSLDLRFIQQVLLLLVISFSALLGLGVFFANHKSKTNIFYFVSAIFIILWVVFGYLVYYPPLSHSLVYIGRINLAIVAGFFISISLFVANFPKERNKIGLSNMIFAIIGVILMLLSAFSNLIVKDITIQGQERIWTFGNFIIFYYCYSLAATFIVIYRLLHKYKEREEKEKAEIRLFFYGLTILASMNIVFNLIYPYLLNNYDYYFLGDFSVAFVLGFSAYAIMKHQLFNIKVLTTEAAVILLSLVLFVQMFISNGITEGIVNAVIWLLATVGGWQLIKSVKHEIQQREQLAKLAKDLKEANEHLKEIDKLKDDFLSMASHELNTPIAAIEGYLSMILQEGLGGKIPPKAREYLESVFQSSQRLAHLVKDLLNVSRIESNRIHIIYEEKQIEDVIDQSIMEVMSKAKEAKHALTFEKPKKQLPKTWLDITRITEILINILGNAIKYTPDGGKIVVKATSDDKKIIVAVQDNGKGIPKEREKAVFEKFSQVDVMKDEVKGTGLGMYIAKKFIELMKGQIWFHSDGANKGTTFYFSLPVLDKKPFDPNEGEGEVLH